LGVIKVSKTGAFVRDAALQSPATHAQLLSHSVISAGSIPAAFSPAWKAFEILNVFMPG
jgi:hypothetical protein